MTNWQALNNIVWKLYFDTSLIMYAVLHVYLSFPVRNVKCTQLLQKLNAFQYWKHTKPHLNFHKRNIFVEKVSVFVLFMSVVIDFPSCHREKPKNYCLVNWTLVFGQTKPHFETAINKWQIDMKLTANFDWSETKCIH